MENRIMVQLSFAGSSYSRVAEIYRLLGTIGLHVEILPTFDCGKNAVLVLPKRDLKKARDAFAILRIHAKEREVLVVHTENKIGAIARISRKISDMGISISQAFLARHSSREAFLILGCSDNGLALKALDGRPVAARAGKGASGGASAPGRPKGLMTEKKALPAMLCAAGF